MNSYRPSTATADRIFSVVLFATLAAFISLGLYLKTIPVRASLLSQLATPQTAMKTDFQIAEQKKEPPLPVKPKPNKEAAVDLTKNPALNQTQDDIQKNQPAPSGAPVRRVYGLRRVYSTGIGAGGSVGDAVIGKLGNTINTEIDTVIATPKDLKGALVSITTITDAPKLQVGVKPEYTPEMLEHRLEGVIKAKLLIDANGNVAEVKIINDLGFNTAEIARRTFLKFRFSPARRGSETVAVWILFSIRFTLLQE